MGKSYEKGKKGKKGKGAKGKVKGKEKEKTKQDGKGTWKLTEKGKSSWEKGPGKKGMNNEKGATERQEDASFAGRQDMWQRNAGNVSNKLRKTPQEHRVRQQDPQLKRHRQRR